MSIKNLFNFFLFKSNSNKKEQNKIVDEIKETILEMEVAESMFNTVNDPKLIDAAIYRDKAAKKRFDYLISIAKKEYSEDKYNNELQEPLEMEI